MNEVVPSASVVLPGVQVKVSAEDGLVGVRLTEAKTGALLLIVTVAVFAVPEALPSLGVTEHTTVLPLTNTPESVLALPFDVPFTVQAYVYETVSPSASAPPEGVQVKVLDAVGELGLMLTLVRVGALLSTVTVFEVTAVPEVVPSVGVASQTTLWPLEK